MMDRIIRVDSTRLALPPVEKEKTEERQLLALRVKEEERREGGRE